MTRTEQIIEEYGLRCAKESADRRAAAERFNAENAALLSLIERLSARDGEITKSGHAGFAQMVAGWENPYHFLRLAAESLRGGRNNDACLASTGRAAAVPHSMFWINRAADFRRRAVALFEAARAARAESAASLPDQLRLSA